MNIQRHGLRRHSFNELYYSILRTSWPRFLIYVALTYVALNLLFAALYLFGGDSIAHIQPHSLFDAFAFSNQTFSTIGYGYYLPKTHYAHVIVAVESVTALLFMAMTTGLTFVKFARPTPNILFSRSVVVTEMDGVPTLMFRLGNGRDSSIVEARLSVTTLVPYRSEEGMTMQRFKDIKLERDRSPFFLLTWTVLHKIDESSPFFGMSQKDFMDQGISIFVNLTGYDEGFAQNVHTAWRYQAMDIQFGKRFVDILETLPGGGRRVDFTKFHDVI